MGLGDTLMVIGCTGIIVATILLAANLLRAVGCGP